MLKFEVIVRIEFELNTYPYSKKITRCLFIILSRTLFLVDLNGLGPFLRVGNRFVITTEIQAGYSYSPSTVCKSGSKMFWPCNRSSGSTFLVYIGKFPGRTRKVSLVPQFFVTPLCCWCRITSRWSPSEIWTWCANYVRLAPKFGWQRNRRSCGKFLVPGKDRAVCGGLRSALVFCCQTAIACTWNGE